MFLQNSGYNNGNPTVGKFSHGNLDNNKGLGCSGGPTGGGPLYSNLGDYPPYILGPEIQAHLLPLQQYILEQAKLSGNKIMCMSTESELFLICNGCNACISCWGYVLKFGTCNTRSFRLTEF
jgi:hypothetical protein